MKKTIVACILTGLLYLPATSDSWPPPQRKEFPSANGRFSLDVIPSPIDSQLAYFRDKVAGRSPERSCRGRLRQLLPGGREQVLWSGDLDNEVAPVEVMVSDSGRWVVTFDNWHSIGFGKNVVAVYGERGQLIFRHSLEEILSPEKIAKLSCSVSSRDWRRGAWLDEEARQLSLVFLSNDHLVINLADGKTSLGGTAQVRKALRNFEGPSLSLPLELAAETKIPALEEFRRLLQDKRQPMTVRLRAATALLKFGDHAGAILVQTQAQKGRPNERAYALAHLGEFLGPAAFPYLLDGITQSDRQVYSAAMEGCKTLGRRAGPVMIAWLSHPSANCQLAAAQILGDLNYIEARPSLMSKLADKDEYVAGACFEALESIGFPDQADAHLLNYLEKGTQIDAKIASLYCQRRDKRAPSALLTALKQHPKRSQSYCNRYGLDNVIAALEFQTGAHLGNDAKAWETYLKETPNSQEKKAQLLLRLGDMDGFFHLSLESNRELVAHHLVSHPRMVQQRIGSTGSGATLAPNGSCVVLSIDQDHTSILKIPDLTEVPLPKAYDTESAAFSRNGDWILLPNDQALQVLSTSGLLRWSAKTSESRPSFRNEISDDSTVIMQAGLKTHIWGHGRVDTPLDLECWDIYCAALSPDGQRITTQTDTGLAIVELRTGQTTSVGKPKQSKFIQCWFSSDSQQLITWSRDGRLQIWDLTGKLVKSFQSKPGHPWSPSFSGQGFLLGLDGDRVIGCIDGRFITLPSSNQDALSLRGDLVLVSGDDGWISVTSLSTGKTLCRLVKEIAGKTIRNKAVLSQDGQHIVTLESGTSQVQVWRLPGLDKADTDVPIELLQAQVHRATGRHWKNGAVADFTHEEYQEVVRRCAELEQAHRTVCKLLH